MKLKNLFLFCYLLFVCSNAIAQSAGAVEYTDCTTAEG